MANDKTVRLLAYIVGGPVYDLPLAYCASGDQGANMRKAFHDGATFYAAMGSLMTVAGLIPTPATPFLVTLGPICLAVAGVFKAVGDGRMPSAGEAANVARAGAPALDAVGGDPTGGQAGDFAGAFAALAETATSMGLVPPLPTWKPSAGSRTARDNGKKMLKLKKAKAKYLALMRGRASSKAKLDACAARGGVFDASAPDGCRVGGSGGKSPVKKKGSTGGTVLKGVALLALGKIVAGALA